MNIFYYLGACVPFLAFLFSCAALFHIRASRNAILWGALCTLTLILALHIPLLSCASLEQIITLLPLTVDVPFIICLHLLSAGGLFETCAVWSTGCLVGMILDILRRLLLLFQPRPGILFLLLLSAAGAALVCEVWFSLRQPFRRWGQEVEENWTTVLAPMLLSFLLLSYISGNAGDPAMLLFTLLAALAVLLALTRILHLSVDLRETRQTERMARQQLELQSRDYRAVRQKMELGRIYRHDLHHHLAALDAILSREAGGEDARRYIRDLRGALSETLPENWCASGSINAMLSAYLSQARENGCQVEAEMQLPELFPFDEIDLCVMLANALENAVNACRELPEERRYIRLSAELTDNQRFILTVENACACKVDFGPDGLPAVASRPGHGLGLRSISAVVEKYRGLLRCQCPDGAFILRTVLFPPMAETLRKEKRRRSMARPLGTAALGLALLYAFLNSSPNLTNALEEVPVLGAAVQALDLRAYTGVQTEPAYYINEAGGLTLVFQQSGTGVGYTEVVISPDALSQLPARGGPLAQAVPPE